MGQAGHIRHSSPFFTLNAVLSISFPLLQTCSAISPLSLCLNPQVAKLFASGSPSEVVLSDCHQLDAPAMTALLQECVTPR